MCRSLSAAVLFLSILPAAAAPPTLKDARQQWLQGNYGQAQSAYEELLKDEKTAPAAALGLSRVLETRGEYDRALTVVDTALKNQQGNADLLARRAELLWLRGRWDAAEKDMTAALAIDRDHLPAIWVRARLNRDRGDLDKAYADYRLIVRTYNDRSATDATEIKDPDLLLIVGLAGAEQARGRKEFIKQWGFIVNTLCDDAVKYEPAFWYADHLAGQLFLEKFNRPDAVDAFNRAIKTNPSAAEAQVGLGVERLVRYEFQDAEKFAQQALKINPKLPEALRLLADTRIFFGDYAGALEALETARGVSPRDERTLGRIAACLRMQGKTKEADALAAEVAAFDAKPAVFFYEYGVAVESRRRFDEARMAFEKAVALRPLLPGPTASLGTLYMRLGDEEKASKLLDAAFEADQFNVRVLNQRKVLKHLAGYETIKTAHFEVRYTKDDKVLATYMAEELERIYEELAAKFAYRPKGPILIEIFDNHEMFSGRVVSLPDLYTIGACTGAMVALLSPNGKAPPGFEMPFNWNRVLRHELVHIFNLEQTHYLVPHWLTEGLAVANEGFPRHPVMNAVLRERVAAGNLLDLDNIDLGFMRPRSREEWTLAYAQANLYVEYIEATYGKTAIADLLDAYRDGLDTTSALRKACKVEKAEFEKGYRTFLDNVVKKMGGATGKKRPKEELEAAWKKDGNDLEAGAELALLELEDGGLKRARELAEAVRAKKMNQPVACLVLATLERKAGNTTKERELLEAGLDRDRPDTRLLLELGKSYYNGKEYAKAAELLELGRKLEPSTRKWLLNLSAVYNQTGEKEKLISVLKELAPTDANNFDLRMELVELLLSTGKPADAEIYARQAVQINIRDAKAREVLLKSLTEQKKDAEADRLRKMFGG
jgi:tetratricopeptide (TPR) repeat protein